MSTRGWFVWQGAVAGIVAGAALVWAMATGWLTAGMPIIAAALSERARALLPLRVLGWFIVTFKFDAKPLGYWITMATVVLACALAGGMLLARRPSLWVVGLTVALVVAVVLTVVAAPPSLNYLAARLGAEGASDAETQALSRVALAIAGYAALTSALFTLGVGLVMRTQAPARAQITRSSLRLHGRGQ